MPAPLNVDREAVRVLCVAVGVREAARQMNIPEATVQAWSARGKWTEAIQNAQRTKETRITIANPVQPLATKAADGLANHLAELGNETRLNLVKAAGKAAKSFGTRSGDAVIKSSKALRDVVAASSTLHGWEESRNAGLTLNLGIAVGQIG